MIIILFKYIIILCYDGWLYTLGLIYKCFLYTIYNNIINDNNV